MFGTAALQSSSVGVRRRKLARQKNTGSGADDRFASHSTEMIDRSAGFERLADALGQGYFELEFMEEGRFPALARHGRAGGRERPSPIPLVRVRRPNARASQLLPGCRDGGAVGEMWPTDAADVLESLLLAMSEGQSYAVGLHLPDAGAGSSFVDIYAERLSRPDGRIHVLATVVDRTDDRLQARRTLETDGVSKMFFKLSTIALYKLDRSGVVAMYRELREQGISDVAAHFDAHPELIDRAMELTIVTDANDAGLRLVAGTREQVVGKAITEFCIPRGPTFRGTLEGRFQGKGHYLQEARLVRTDGKIIPTLFCTASSPEMANLGVAVAAHIDISELIAAREAVADMERHLAHSARVAAVGELAASIAHEVSQPLAAITTSAGAARLWLEREPPEPAHAIASVERMLRYAARATEVLERIKDMVANRTPEKCRVSVQGIMEEAAAFLEHEVQRHQASLQLVHPTADMEIMACRIQIQQVLVNLVMNSLQAMTEAKSPQRQLMIELAEEAQYLVLSVVDTGPGLGPDGAARLFNSFHSTKSDGLGLGLAICRSIVESHGGTVTGYDREDGHGARFEVRIPALPPEGKALHA